MTFTSLGFTSEHSMARNIQDLEQIRSGIVQCTAFSTRLMIFCFLSYIFLLFFYFYFQNRKFEIEFGYNHVGKLTFFFSELTIVLFSKIVNHLSEILLWQFFFPGTRGEFQGQVYPADEGVSCQDWW